MRLLRLVPFLLVALAGCDPGSEVHGTITGPRGPLEGASVKSVAPCADFLPEPLFSDAKGQFVAYHFGPIDPDCNFFIERTGFEPVLLGAGERCDYNSWWAECLEIDLSAKLVPLR